MKLTTAKEQRDHFTQKGTIELEGLLSDDQLAGLHSGISLALSKRMQLNPETVFRQPPELQFVHGHDLWRTNDSVKKNSTNKNFAQLASEFTDQRVIRLGYDQLFPSPQSAKHSFQQEGTYEKFLDRTLSLEELCCIQGVVCGLMLCLKTEDLINTTAGGTGISIIPSKAGNGIFFNKSSPIDFSSWKNYSATQCILIIYAQDTSIYINNSHDPHVYFLKQFDYIYNDRLKDKTHPVLYRR